MNKQSARSVLELAVVAVVAVVLSVTLGVGQGLLATVGVTAVYGVVSVLLKFRRAGGVSVLTDTAARIAKN